MNQSTFDTIGDEPVEARIVAWVLGEASAFEAAELERLCEERPELLIFRRRMRALHRLLTESEATETDEEWKLPAEKRKVLDEIFGVEKIVRLDAAREASIRHSGRRVILAIAACLILTLVVLQLIPRGYESKVVLEVRPRSLTNTALGAEFSGSTGSEPMTPQFFGTEFGKIKSRSSLGKVVDKLGLADRWKVDRDTAVAKLKSKVEIENPNATDLIEIKVRDASEQDSKEIVREVAHAYKDYRSEIENREADKALYELNKAVRDQEDKVEERRKVLATIVRTKGIIYRGQDSFYNSGGGMDEDKVVMKDDSREEAIKRGLDAQDYVDAKRDFETDQELLQKLRLSQIDNLMKSKMTEESIVIHEEPDVTTKGKFSESEKSLAAVEGQKKKNPKLKPTAPSQPPAADLAYNLELAPTRKPSAGESAKQRQLAQMNEPATPLATLEAPGAFPELPQSPVAAPPPPPLGIAGLSGRNSISGGLGGNGSGAGFGMAKDAPPVVTAPAAALMPEGEVAWAANSKSPDSPAPAKPMAFAGKITNEQVAGYSDGAVILNGGTKASGKPVDEKAGKGSKDDLSPPPPVLAARRPTAQPDEKPLSGPNTYAGSTTVSAGTVNAPISSLEEKEMAAPQEPMDSLASGFDGDKAAAGDGGQLRRDKGAADKRAGGDFISPVDGTSGDGIPADSDNFTANGVTNGLRSGDQAINRNNIDAILNNPNRAREVMPSLSKNKANEESEVSARSDVAKAKPDADAAAQKRLDDVVYSDQEKAPAFDSTRAELMKSVEAAWELPVPFTVTAGSQQDLYFRSNSGNEGKDSSLNEADELQRKPEVNFDGFVDNGSLIQDAPVPALVDLMEEIPASDNPYSTFSLNINDASFQTAKAALDKGERPDPESIKPEQFYNAVDYGDPAPTADQAVAATIEQSAHPVIPGRSLVRVALRVGATGHAKAQPLRLTLLVDQSGSMVREDRRAAMEQALAQLGGLLTKDDVISVVGFSRLPHLLADGMTGDQAGKLGELVNQTASEGGTNLEEAMKVGEQLALRHQLAGAQNRIVLFTDGAANLGNANPEKLAEEVKSLRQKGIAFDIAGIGADGLNDRLLGELARHGNGRYYVVSDTKDAHFAQQLAGAFHPAAENVKVQVNFNPQRVGKYKLLGFEKDRLKTEDFRNDAVDAAELAAEEAGVAIYQVETLPEGSGEIGEVSVRFRDAASGEMVERSWTVPNETSVSAFDRATPSMQLAGLSLLAAEKLRGGPLGDAIDFNQLAGPRALVKQYYKGSARVADMLQVIEKLK